VAAQTSVGSAKNLQLTRAARVAGEAFAFNEPEASERSKRSYAIGLLGLALCVITAVALITLT
jgi:hypothetical protein